MTIYVTIIIRLKNHHIINYAASHITSLSIIAFRHPSWILSDILVSLFDNVNEQTYGGHMTLVLSVITVSSLAVYCGIALIEGSLDTIVSPIIPLAGRPHPQILSWCHVALKFAVL